MRSWPNWACRAAPPDPADFLEASTPRLLHTAPPATWPSAAAGYQGRKAIPHPGSGEGRVVTVSMGVGTVVPGAEDEADMFPDRIDRRLYLAKSAGRDRICDEDPAN